MIEEWHIKLFALIVIFTMLICGVNYYNKKSIILHEGAHEQIAKYHGCIEGNTTITMKGRSSFVCLEYRERSPEVIANEYYLHSMNEIVGYNVQSLLNMITFGIMMIISTLFIVGWMNE